MAKRKKTVQIRKHKGAFDPPMLSEVPAFHIKGDWAVTYFNGNPPTKYSTWKYWLTHIPTGLGCGRFMTQKTAIAACKEIAELPCTATLAMNGLQHWPKCDAEGPAIVAVLQKWVDSEREEAA